MCVLLICVTDKNGSLKIMNLNDNYVFIVVTKLIAENAGNSGCVPQGVYIYILLWCKELSNYVDVHDDILVKTIKIRLKSVKLFLSFKLQQL